VVAEVAFLSDYRAVADMGEGPNPRARAHYCARINEGLGMKGHESKAEIGKAEIVNQKQKAESGKLK
jgi:hypothetical protein